MEKLIVSEILKPTGVEETTAIELNEAFKGFLLQAEEWTEKANSLIVTDVSQVDEMKQAKEGRIALKAVRVAADKKRKELKAESLKYGQAVQTVYNAIEAAIKPIELHLLKQEKFAEIEKEKEIKILSEKRLEETKNYADFIPRNIDYGNLSENDYQNLLNGAKLQFEAKQKEAAELEAKQIKDAAKAKEEHERVFNEKEKERLRILKENEALRAEADKREIEIKKEREKHNIELELQRKESEEIEAKKKQLEAEILATKEAEEEAKRKADEEIEEKKQSELRKDDAEKLADFHNALTELYGKYNFESELYKNMHLAAKVHINEIINFVQPF